MGHEHRETPIGSKLRRSYLRKDDPVADLGEGPGKARLPLPLPLFWVKKEEMSEGRKAGRASKTKAPPSSSSPP